ncbi:MAG: hypothetical protein P4L73_19535 [Caulobacteraceae bacterium]|nr:hypothetical protein [Caulobacteraceae bacterium]
MRRTFRLGLMFGAAAVCAASLMPAASAQDDPAPRVDILREQSLQDTPRVTLPRGVVEAASVYESYLRRAAAIRASFRDGEAVRTAMTVGESYQPEQLQEGLIAYAALIALEDVRFVKGVRVVIRTPEEADREAERLLADPAQVAAIPGAGHAAALVSAELRQEGGQLFEAGRAVKQSAYDVQHQAWSKRTVPDQSDRLARAKSLAASAVIPAPEEVAHLLQTAATFRGREAEDQDPSGATPAIQRGLPLAALALLGEANDEARLSPILSEGSGAGCMHMAKLNLYQCLAVAGPHYEDIFCLGQHALMDTGSCVAAVGGEDPARMGTRAVAIPVAENSYSR